VDVETLAAAHRHLAPVPDCIVLDLTLPDGDGATLLAALQARGLNGRVVVSTGATGLTRLATVEELEPGAVLLKPYAPEQLVRACQSVVESSVTAGAC
jgi:two-component system response regulator MprA